METFIVLSRGKTKYLRAIIAFAAVQGLRSCSGVAKLIDSILEPLKSGAHMGS
jgi:hypothetical protein